MTPRWLDEVRALVGPRGDAARAATTATDALTALLGSYVEQVAAYAQRFPGLSPGRLLLLAVVTALGVLHRLALLFAPQFGLRLDLVVDGTHSRRQVASAPHLEGHRLVCITLSTPVAAGVNGHVSLQCGSGCRRPCRRQ